LLQEIVIAKDSNNILRKEQFIQWEDEINNQWNDNQLDEIDGFSFNNSEDIEPEIENNIIDEITNRLEFSYSEEINNEDNEMNYEIDKGVEVDEIEETNRLEISYSKEINNETNEIDEIDEANNDDIEIDEINNEDAIDEI
ncbi:13235_t:CDS:1, partial [Cetraspora pellucida]